MRNNYLYDLKNEIFLIDIMHI